MGESVDAPESNLSSTLLAIRGSVGALFVWSLFGSSALAASSTVYRCTGANGKVTLSDRRCPEDDAASKSLKTDPAKPGASAPASADAPLDAKQCGAMKTAIDERRKVAQPTDAQRKSLRQSEAEHQRRCTG